MKILKRVAFWCFAWTMTLVLVFGPPAQSQQEKPPAPVAVAAVKQGKVVPDTEFVGTVYYREVSEVAAEVSGKAIEVNFDEGDRVEKGAPLVRMDARVLAKSRDVARSGYQEAMAELENARIELKRLERIYRKGSLSPQEYDDQTFKVKRLERKVEGLRAVAERIDIEMEKKTVPAPFDGVVLERKVDRGEWLSEGSVIAHLARYDEVDIRVNVPEEVLLAIAPGTEVQVSVAGTVATGEISAVIARGDVATRTFPVEIRMKNTPSLVEGMEARVSLPAGKPREALMAPRDAVIDKFGRTVLFAVVDGKAKMIPVKIVGFEGMEVGVEAPSLEAGMQVVVKGNERLNEGQPVRPAGGSESRPQKDDGPSSGDS